MNIYGVSVAVYVSDWNAVTVSRVRFYSVQCYQEVEVARYVISTLRYKSLLAIKVVILTSKPVFLAFYFGNILHGILTVISRQGSINLPAFVRRSRGIPVIPGLPARHSDLMFNDHIEFRAESV